MSARFMLADGRPMHIGHAVRRPFDPSQDESHESDDHDSDQEINDPLFHRLA